MYKILTYNLGHGKYNKEYYKGLKVSRKTIYMNFKGQIELIKKINPDFILTQENGSKISLNQYRIFVDELSEYNSIYYSHSKTINTGNASFSKIKGTHYKITTPYKVNNVKANLLLLNKNKIMSEYKINDKNLIIFNIHFIAYLKYRDLRIKQMKYIFHLAKKEYEKGNYVIIGGDFNEEISVIKDNLMDYFKMFFPNKGTLRTSEFPYTKDSKTYIIDGFIVSKNLKIKKVESLFNFDYSDHSPVIMYFTIQ